MPRRMQKFLRSSATEAAEEAMSSAFQSGLRVPPRFDDRIRMPDQSRRRSNRSRQNKPTAAHLAAIRKLKKKKRKIPSRSQALFDILGGVGKKMEYRMRTKGRIGY